MPPAQQREPLTVFLSYAHEDARHKDRLRAHLRPLERDGVIGLWHDRMIKAGHDWEKEIDRSLEAAHIFVALLTVDFTASDYIYGEEVRRAWQRSEEMALVPIWVNFCPLDEHFKRLQVLPSLDKPILDYDNQDKGWDQVRVGIEEIVTKVLERRARARPRIWPPTTIIKRVERFTGRADDLAELRSRFVGSSVQAIVAESGAGKSTLAAEYAWRHQPDYDVVWWVRGTNQEGLRNDFANLSDKLGLSSTQQSPNIKQVREWLETYGGKAPHRWLLVFDDVPDPASIGDLLPPTHLGHVLITSRIASWEDAAQTTFLRGLPVDTAAAYLKEHTGREDDDEAFEALAEALGGSPKGLKQAAADIKERNLTVHEYLSQLRQGGDQR